MATVFTKIIQRTIPAYIVAEDPRHIAFLDLHPLTKGHTLVVPKQEVDHLFDLKDTDLQHLALFTKRVAQALQKTIPCKRIGLAVLGFEIPHAHIHLVPLHTERDLDFQKPRPSATKEELEKTAATIRLACS